MTTALRSSTTAFCLSAFLLFSTVTGAQQRQQDFTIHLKTGVLTPAANAQHWLDSTGQRHYSATVAALLQFYRMPDETQRRVLHAAGIDLLDYIPNRCYTALLHLPLRPGIFADIRSITPLKPEWKIDTRLAKELNLNTAARTHVLVSFTGKQVSLPEIEQMLQSYGGTIIDRRFAPANTYEVVLAQNKIYALAKEPFVKYISLPAVNQPLNRESRAGNGAAMLQSPLYGLDGTGVTIGVGDNTSAIYHVDARDRVINFNTEPPTLHGIHTTLTAAGNGTMDPRTRGMAPRARIVGHLYDLVWAQTPSMLQDYNMTVTNNSYAAIVNDCVYAGTYDQYSQLLDEYALQYPEALHVFASGNDGLNTCNGYPQSFNTVVGSYQAAKNVLVVGGTAKDNILWPKSARGPVKDGRLKPEVMAFSFQIFSGDVFDMYGGSNGTSMSTPAVTGCLALLEQRYHQLHANANAPGALLKPLMMNGAFDLGNPGPDFTFGFGQVDMYRTLQMLENNRYFFDSVADNVSNSHTLSVPANTAQLKLMLYWNDLPAAVQATDALVNDLDLKVTEPNNTVHQPLILDPSTGGVSNNAVEGTDTRNNVEQVVISNPQAGNYTIAVKGATVTSGKQPYSIVYDFIPVGVKLKYPVVTDPVPANDSMKIYWDASDDVNGFTLEYSDNGGGSWNMINNAIPAGQRYCTWQVPNISTAQALVRLKRNNTAQQDVSGLFPINPEPLAQLDAVQCPGYIAISWNAISNTSGYELLRKIGSELQPVDTVTGTSYVFSGLSPDSLEYVAVRPLINGVRGYRSKAIRRRPDDGNCSGSISDGDLMAAEIINPGSGRRLTSTALTANETLSVLVRNLDDAPSGNYRVSYSLNGGAWQTQLVTTPIPATGSAQVSFTGLNLSPAGNYIIRAAVQNLAATDPVKTNDTLQRSFRQLSNAPVDIDNIYTDGFENNGPITLLKDSVGITPDEHWDFSKSDTGRLRSFVSSDVLISGQRSLSMDLLYNRPDNQNYLTGTFNLAAYDTANSEARLEFDYKLHGKPKFEQGNEVWVRGDDSQPWLSIYQFDTAAVPGQVINTGSLSLTDAFTGNGQNFSSSFQVRIGQHDTSVIAMNEYGNGLTIDNFKLYTVKNDVQLLSILNPSGLECGLAANTPLSILVYNSDNLPQTAVQVHYRLDNGPVVSETIDTIAAKDTVVYTFVQPLNAAAVGYHTLDVWLVATGDTYLPNDSILNYRFRNQPLVSSFPYLERFENGEGNWFTEGQNDSWQYGVPNSVKIHSAASGTRAWVTNLTGNYNDNELSYLYSPCFDLSGLSAPMLSFSLSTDIENCDSLLCDAAYLEYSADGQSWTKLGASGEGFNWYSYHQVWNEVDTRWRVASIPLPAGLPSLKLRFVFHSDAGAARDGIAVDDIHIFQLEHPVYEAPSVKENIAVNGSGWIAITSNGGILAEIDPKGQSLGNTELSIYTHPASFNPVLRQYYLPRNFVIHTAQAPADTVGVRLFVTDAEVLRMVNDQSCSFCDKAPDAYRLGITKYDAQDKSLENGSLSDNRGGAYSFIPYTAVQWVPYERGYYAQTGLGSFSELWFSTAPPDKQLTPPLIYPNPVTGSELNIVWNAAPGTEMQLVIADMLGRVVYRSGVLAEDFDNLTRFRLPAMGTGVYIARFIIAGETHEEKLIIQ